MGGGSPVPAEVAAAISEFGDISARKLRIIGRDEDCVPEKEEQIREPIATLLTEVGRRLGQDVLLYGEVKLRSLRARPDFGVDVAGQQAGFLEIKAPGRGVPPDLRQSLSEKRQWQSLTVLPNLVYTDGTTWAHYTYGRRDAIGVLEGDLYTAGPRLRATDGQFMDVIKKLLFGSPKVPNSLSGVVRTAAGLCRLMRDEVATILRNEGADPERRPQFSRLARDWQGMLFPNLRLEDFPDAYAQTVTFAMLLACAAEVPFEDKSIAEIADQLAKHHPLMGKALFVLTRPAAEQELTVPEVLRGVLAPVRWETLKGVKTAYWLLYEDFLREYDPTLQRATGSYYTPDLVARFMVDFTDQVLKQSMNLPRGFASEEVTAVDPAMGTGTFLVEILRSAARTIAAEQSEEARPPYLRDMYRRRLIGLERQAAPYAVAELRMHQALKSYKAEVPESSSRYLADTLDDPNARVLDYPELYEDFRDSREGANRVKLDTRVMAVITNPPWRERAARRDPVEWITRRREKHKPTDISRPSIDDFRMDNDLAYKLANRKYSEVL